MGNQEIKVPPQNTEAEMAVLGSMLISEDAIPLALEVVDVDCFYRDANRLIFSAILELYNNQKSIDLITLSDELKRKGSLDSVGGIAYLTNLTEAVPTAAN
ncbi:MAG: DnaB-like helicase N-terminal domain-containing protein, partial [Candidatus Omnitrophota bacterium]